MGITSALRGLTDQLQAGHTHDVEALKTGKSDAVKTTNEAKTAYELATKEHANANTACKNAAAEYATLITEVESNVGSRKEVYIATEVVKCYLADLDDNDAAKSCADIARTKDTSSWNIVPGKLAPCASTAELTGEFGPKNWLPTAKTCPSEHWNKKDDVEFYATLYDN